MIFKIYKTIFGYDYITKKYIYAFCKMPIEYKLIPLVRLISISYC